MFTLSYQIDVQHEIIVPVPPRPSTTSDKLLINFKNSKKWNFPKKHIAVMVHLFGSSD